MDDDGQHRNVSKLFMTNNTSPSVEADESSRDKLSTGFLGGINGCSIGTMTVNCSDSFLNIKESVDTD